MIFIDFILYSVYHIIGDSVDFNFIGVNLDHDKHYFFVFFDQIEISFDNCFNLFIYIFSFLKIVLGAWFKG